MISRLVAQTFPDVYKPTIAADYLSAEVTINENVTLLQVAYLLADVIRYGTLRDSSDFVLYLYLYTNGQTDT